MKKRWFISILLVFVLLIGYIFSNVVLWLFNQSSDVAWFIGISLVLLLFITAPSVWRFVWSKLTNGGKNE